MDNEPCLGCQENLRRVQIVSAAVGVAVGGAVAFLAFKFLVK